MEHVGSLRASPFPLDGGGLGGGVRAGGGNRGTGGTVEAFVAIFGKTGAHTPNPDPSPVEGEGRRAEVIKVFHLVQLSMTLRGENARLINRRPPNQRPKPTGVPTKAIRAAPGE